MMLSLKAIELTPELRTIPREEIAIIGSVTVALFKATLGIPSDEQHIHIDDLDLSVPQEVYALLDCEAKDKADLMPGENAWVRNGYRGVHTVRRNVAVPGLSRLVQLDIGTGAHSWSHEDLLGSGLMYDGYRVIDPRQQLAWYEALGRKKDQQKIKLLSTTIIPALDRLIVRGDSE